MSEFDTALSILSRELHSASADFKKIWRPSFCEHAIFGSASLVLRGYLDREPGDIDVFVSRRVWGALLARPGWEVLTPHVDHTPILAYPTACPLNLFFDWSGSVIMHHQDYLAKSEFVDYKNLSFKCIPVTEALRHKEEALQLSKVRKHIADIDEIEHNIETRLELGVIR